MASFTVGLSAVSVQSAKPNQAFGSVDHPALESGAREVLTRAALPNLPAEAVITKAEVRFNAHGSWSGSVTMCARRMTAGFTGKATWNTRPAVTGTTYSTTQTDASSFAAWAIDVTADVVAFYAGSYTNYGWRLYSTSSTFRRMRGATATSMRPYLYVEYSTAPAAPTNLIPAGGAVDVDKPVLSFAPPEDMTAAQFQVDAAEDGGSPDWDSGTVSLTRGIYDLSGSTYTGLADEATTSWRVRAQTSQGWSPWSSWATFSRVDFDTLTITSPSSTPADPSPTVAWTYGGTQQAWQAQMFNAQGQKVADSGRTPGTATAWQSPKSLGRNGAHGTIIVRVWDSALRSETPGRSGYVEETLAVTVTLASGVAKVDTLTAFQDGTRPCVSLTGTRAGELPSELLVMRRDGDGEWVEALRVSAAEVFTGAAFTIEDWTAPAVGWSEYMVLPVVAGQVADDSPRAGLRPTHRGLWLVDDSDPSDVAALVVLDQDAGTWSRDELATVHEVADGGFIRRRLALVPRLGSCSGRTADAMGFKAVDMLATAERFRRSDAGRVYRLVAGHLNIPVIAGDITAAPSPLSTNGDVIAHISWNWWEAEV